MFCLICNYELYMSYCSIVINQNWTHNQTFYFVKIRGSRCFSRITAFSTCVFVSVLNFDIIAMTIAPERQRYDRQVERRRSQTERKTHRQSRSVYVCMCLCVSKSLNSYLLCMCQMALCTLLLHNQNSESHFHAHTCSHCQAHTCRTTCAQLKNIAHS